MSFTTDGDKYYRDDPSDHLWTADGQRMGEDLEEIANRIKFPYEDTQELIDIYDNNQAWDFEEELRQIMAQAELDTEEMEDPTDHYEETLLRHKHEAESKAEGIAQGR